MRGNRFPTSDELRLIEYLAHKANYALVPNWSEQLRVRPLTNNSIGSIEIINNAQHENANTQYKEIANCMYYDNDGVCVAVYLLVNKDNQLCEIDMWKGDDSPIHCIPESGKMENIAVL